MHGDCHLRVLVNVVTLPCHMSIEKLVRTFSHDGVVANRIERWLLGQQGQVNVDESLHQRLLELASPGETDRSAAFHASQIGGCHRRSLFDFHDLPKRVLTDSELALKFMDGTWRHIRWQMMLLMSGLAYDVEVPVAIPELRFTGSMDALGNDGEDYGIEVKGWSAIPSEVVPYHYVQVQGYMMMSGLNRFVVLYEHKSTQTVKEFLVLPDKQVQDEIRAELEHLNALIDDESIPEMLTGCMQQKGETFRDCPYRHICSDVYEWDDLVRLSQGEKE